MPVTTSPDPLHHKIGRFLPLAVVAAGALCLWKLHRSCSVKVHPNCVAVVYDTRRRSILRTTADNDFHREGLPRTDHFSPLLYISSVFLRRSSTLFVPPSSFFGCFTLPRSVFEPPGEAVDCTVEHLQLPDGAVDLYLTIRYILPFSQLERYLSAVGPQPPNERITVAAANVLRAHSADLSVGLLLSRSRREAMFMEGYRDHLATKLLSEVAVKLVDVVIENAELIEGA